MEWQWKPMFKHFNFLTSDQTVHGILSLCTWIKFYMYFVCRHFELKTTVCESTYDVPFMQCLQEV